MSEISGVVNFYKDRGLTSFKATEKVKKIFGVKKAGHGGTLDPEAEGVLPVFLGSATRISALFLKAEKEYRVFFLFGIETDSFDMSGKITKKIDDFRLDSASLHEALKSFEGSYLQKPPRFSALKIKGKRAYELARKGVDFELNPRRVTCQRVDCIRLERSGAEVYIVCESGFYIRSMARDLSEKLGIPVTTKNIIRERAGFLQIVSSYRLEDLESLKRSGKMDDAVISIDDALPNIPDIYVDERGEKLVVRGSRPDDFLPEDSPPGKYKVKNPKGKLIALIEKVKGDTPKYMCVFPKG